MFVPITSDSSLHIYKHPSRYLNMSFFLILEANVSNDMATETEYKNNN